MKKQTPTPTSPPVVSFTKIEEVRLELGITKREMARRIGISQVAYGQISRPGGPDRIRMDTLTKILRSGVVPSGMTVGDLFVVTN